MNRDKAFIFAERFFSNTRRGYLALAQSVVTLPLGKIVSVDFRRPGAPLPPNTYPPDLLRAEVRAQVDIVSAGIPSESLRRSLEVFDTSSGATTVFMGGTAP
jgi:hypothetical protein